MAGGAHRLHRRALHRASRWRAVHPAALFPLGSALCFGLYQLLTRMLANSDSPTTSNFLAGIFNTLIMSLLVPFFWQTQVFSTA